VAVSAFDVELPWVDPADPEGASDLKSLSLSPTNPREQWTSPRTERQLDSYGRLLPKELNER
jgi:hypothetical protein